jgi:hypothetical protein
MRARTCTKISKRFGVHLECNSLNTYKSDTPFKQELQRNFVHILCAECTLCVTLNRFAVTDRRVRTIKKYYAMGLVPNFVLKTPTRVDPCGIIIRDPCIE